MTNLRKIYLEDGSWCWKIEVDGNIALVSDDFLQKLMDHSEIKELADTDVDIIQYPCYALSISQINN